MCVLEDADLTMNLLIGHTYSDHPKVLIVKTNKHLTITELPYVDHQVEGEQFLTRRVNEVDIIDSQQSFDSSVCGDLSAHKKAQLINLLYQYQDRFCFELSQLAKLKRQNSKSKL